MSKIAYCFADEVNRWVVDSWSRPNVAVCSNASDVPADCDAVVYGLDHFPIDLRRRIVDDLKTRLQSVPTAVHSNQFNKQDVRALQLRRVIVADRSVDESLLALVEQRLATFKEAHIEVVDPPPSSLVIP